MNTENNFLKLNKKVAIITGAASGLGASTAQMLSQAGVKVIINHVPGQEDQAESVSKSCSNDSLCVAGDITKDDDCKRIVEFAMKKWGQVDILVNNAGINMPVEHTDLDGLSSDDFINIYKVNVIGAYQMTRAVAPIMQRGRGVVVNVSSASGDEGYGSSIAYSASKGAMNTMTKSLARALAPEIRVNAICPGYVMTPLLDKFHQTEEQRAAWRKELVANSPLKAEPTPERVARNILYLVSDLSAHITGQRLTADGGGALGLYLPMYDNQ